MGNKLCTSGNKEDRDDARAEKKAKNRPTDKTSDDGSASPNDIKVDVPVGTVEIERVPEDEEESKEEAIAATTVEATSAEKPSSTTEASEDIKEEKQEKEGENQEGEAEDKKVSDATDASHNEGITVAKAETLEIREDIVQRVTIETVQVSMTEYIDDEGGEGQDAKAKAAEAVATTVEQYDSPEDRAKAKENFLLRFREDHKIHAVDFMRIWKNYDKDKSGFLEGKELTGFIKDLLESKGEKRDKKTVADYVTIIMSTFDYNKDKKLEIGELGLLLPVEHNFLDKFTSREKSLDDCTREDFDKVFNHYDKDESGFIGHTELVTLLKDLFQKEGPKMPMQDMTSYADAVFEIYDTSKDGRLSKDELALVLTKKK